FLLDWTFSMGRFERAFTLLLIAGAAAAVYWTMSRRWFGWRENELDVALLGEKQRGIDSDLVAALQFGEPAAPGAGRSQLQEAVVEYVADFAKEWNLLGDFPRDQMRRRAALVAATVLVIGLAAALWPVYASTLLNRLALGSRHYPTITRIRTVTVG